VPDQTVRIRAVLIFPPFRLKRKRDARLLGLVAILYYVISPAAFILLALSGPWMWPLSLLAFLCHILFVPQIWVPNGDERASAAAAPVARRSGERRRWIEMPEGLVLALACIYFVAAPPLIALGGKLMPGVWINGVFALFIATLLIPLFLIPREFESKPAIGGGRSSGYRWLPVITAANMLLLQQLLRPGRRPARGAGPRRGRHRLCPPAGGAGASYRGVVSERQCGAGGRVPFRPTR